MNLIWRGLELMFALVIAAVVFIKAPVVFEIANYALVNWKAKRNVNRVFSVRLERSLSSGGTGFWVRYKGKDFAVTAGHVCSLAYVKRRFLQLYSDDFSQTVLAKIRMLHVGHDLCVLSPMQDFKHESFALAPHGARKYEYIWTLGYPGLGDLIGIESKVTDITTVELPLDPELANDPISGKWCADNTIVLPDIILFGFLLSSGGAKFCLMRPDSYVMPFKSIGGQSGSPILNKKNQVVGVLNAGTNRKAFTFAVQHHHLKELLEDAVKAR